MSLETAKQYQLESDYKTELRITRNHSNCACADCRYADAVYEEISQRVTNGQWDFSQYKNRPKQKTLVK